MTSTRVKICCIQDIQEAELAIHTGASAIGLVSEMPSGPGVIGEDMIRNIASEVPEGIDTFLLTSKQSAEEIVRQHAFCQTSTIQLVDAVPAEELRILRKELPETKLVQVIHVQHAGAIEDVLNVEPLVDMILLDSGNPKAINKELGGTGRTHNWDISAEIVQRATKPVFLAGGLNPGNVSEAIQHVKPYGVDICSGVRTIGHLDPEKLRHFFQGI